MKLAAKMGFKRYKNMIEGPSNRMTNDTMSQRFIRYYVKPEEKAVRDWMASGEGKSYLDVGAGQGRYSKMAMKSGASGITAVDIDEKCIEKLNEKEGVSATLMDAREMEFEDSTFDRVIMFGNTLANICESTHGREKSFAVEVLREMIRVAKEEVALTFQRPESFRTLLQYYRMNGIKIYDYDFEKGIKRGTMIDDDGRVYEFRSQHFRREDIEKLLKKAGVSEAQYEIKPINRMNWMVIIKKYQPLYHFSIDRNPL